MIVHDVVHLIVTPCVGMLRLCLVEDKPRRCLGAFGLSLAWSGECSGRMRGTDVESLLCGP